MTLEHAHDPLSVEAAGSNEQSFRAWVAPAHRWKPGVPIATRKLPDAIVRDALRNHNKGWVAATDGIGVVDGADPEALWSPPGSSCVGAESAQVEALIVTAVHSFSHFFQGPVQEMWHQ